MNIVNKETPHYRFICSFFKEVKDQDILLQLPKETDKNDKDGTAYKIITWFSHQNNNLFIPFIEDDNKQYFYIKLFCTCCEKWIKHNFKSFCIDQHLATREHRCLEYKKGLDTAESNELISSTLVEKNLILFILIDGKPLSTIDNEYFQNIESNIINRQSLTKALIKMSEDFIQIIKSITQNMISSYICIDEWSDKTQRSFIGSIIRGVDDDSLKNFLVSFKYVDDDMNVNAKYLQDIVTKIISDFGLSQNFRGITSDGASNMRSAFDNNKFNRHCCICHVFNLLLHDIHELFSKRFQNLHYIQSLTKNSSSFSSFCRIKNCPVTKISSYSQSRWYSIIKMVHSFNCTYSALILFLNEKGKQNPFTHDDLMFFQEFELFLSYFQSSIQYFEEDSFGQISKVHAELHTLKEQLSVMMNNSELLIKNKKEINEIINNRFQMITDSYGDLLYATSLLHPIRFYSKFLTEDEKNKGLSYIKNLIQIESSKNKQSDEINSYFDGDTRSQKEFIIRNQIALDNQFDELDHFLNSSPSREKDAFAFWKKQKSQYPTLFKVVFQLLSIPTSSASIERIFSKSKQLLGDKQLKTGEKLLESRMIIVRNKKLFHDFFDAHWLEYFKHD